MYPISGMILAPLCGPSQMPGYAKDCGGGPDNPSSIYNSTLKCKSYVHLQSLIDRNPRDLEHYWTDGRTNGRTKHGNKFDKKKTLREGQVRICCLPTYRFKVLSILYWSSFQSSFCKRTDASG